MGGETVAAEGNEKKFTPLRVVGVLEVKGDGDVGFDGVDEGGWGGRVVVGGGNGVFGFVIREMGELLLAGGEGFLALLEVSLEGFDFVGRHGERGGAAVVEIGGGG
jgi:hypothetical protein